MRSGRVTRYSDIGPELPDWAVWLAGRRVLVNAAVLSEFSTVQPADAHLHDRRLERLSEQATTHPTAGRDASRSAVWARPAGLPVPWLSDARAAAGQDGSCGSPGPLRGGRASPIEFG
jgi:hypothetical protein